MASEVSDARVRLPGGHAGSRGTGPIAFLRTCPSRIRGRTPGGFRLRPDSAVLSCLPSVLVVLPLAGLALYWDERRMVFARPLHGGANPVAAARQVIRGIEPYLFDHGNFRPIGRLWEWLVIAFAYDASEATALPPHVVLGGIRLLMAACVALSAAAIVRALMRSADVQAGSLVSLYPLALAAALITNRGGGALGAFPHMFAGSVALMLVIALMICRDSDLEPRALQIREYLLMASSGVVAAAFYDLMYLTPVLAAVFVASRAVAAAMPFRALLGTAAARRWLVHTVAFIVVFVPTRAVIAVNCASGGCYDGSALSLSSTAAGATLGRLWSGFPPFGWAEASERAQRAGVDLGFADLWGNSSIVIVVLAIAVVTAALARTAEAPVDALRANQRHGRLAVALALLGIATTVGSALVAGLSEGMQNRQPAVGVSWRETLLTQVGWSFVTASCLVVLHRAVFNGMAQRVLRSAVAIALALAMAATLLANWQQAETRRRNDVDALTSMVAASAVLPADGRGANDARCRLIAALTEEAPDGWAGGEMVRADLEQLWLTHYGLPYCDTSAK